MERWLVNHSNGQFAVDGLEELRQLASEGKVGAGDMVQPPGATDWLYAAEIPELKGLLGTNGSAADDDLVGYKSEGLSGPVKAVLAVVLLAVVGVGGAGMAYFYSQLTEEAPKILDSLTYSEMLVTEANAPLRAEPEEGASTLTSLPKDSTLVLLSKRGDFYRAKPKTGGSEGWVKVSHVLPMYQLGGKKVREEFDPLYNPDRYVVVRNASWLQLDERNTQLTVFNFQLHNQSRYPITDLRLMATVKDAKGNEVERVEIGVEGEIPAWAATMVGTLEGDPRKVKRGEEEERRLLTNYTFSEISEEDPDLMLRWKDGVEVEMKTKDFAAAEIDILELRAIPEAQPKPKRR